MPEPTNLMDALVYLQNALDAATVRMQRCEIYPNLRVLVDNPNGDLRVTYARVIGGTVQSMAVFVLTKSVGAVARFSLGFAVNESRRGRGLGKQIVVQAIDEILRGMTRNGIAEFYVMAAVPESNIPANRVAARVISDSPDRATPPDFDEPTLIYHKLITKAPGGVRPPVANSQIKLNRADIIPEETVVAVSEEIRAFSPDHATREIERVGRVQPGLYAFVAPLFLDLSPEAMHLALSIYVAIVRMFEKHFGERLRAVDPQPVQAMLSENFLKLNNLMDPDGRPPGRLTEELSKQQPEVWSYVADSLFESEPGLKLSREDGGELALIMITVIHALNLSVGPIKD